MKQARLLWGIPTHGYRFAMGLSSDLDCAILISQGWQLCPLVSQESMQPFFGVSEVSQSSQLAGWLPSRGLALE